MFGHHPHRLGHLCVKFRFCGNLFAELAHGEKSRTHSITQSLRIFDVGGTKAFALEHTDNSYICIRFVHKLSGTMSY